MLDKISHYPGPQPWRITWNRTKRWKPSFAGTATFDFRYVRSRFHCFLSVIRRKNAEQDRHQSSSKTRSITAGTRFEFQQRDQLKRHQAEVHSNRRSFECGVCKKKLLHRQSLRDHKLMHTNVKPFECSICKKRFLRPSSLRAHMIVHTADSPFQCDLCPAKFKRSSVLKTHKLTHTGVRRFECDICKHRFHLKGALKHHILSHYGENICQTRRVNLMILAVSQFYGWWCEILI